MTKTHIPGILAGLAPNIYRTKNEAGILIASLHNETKENDFDVRVLGEEATPMFESKVRFTAPETFKWTEELGNGLPFANFSKPVQIEVLATRSGTILRNTVSMLGWHGEAGAAATS